jgi:hypothetical protein
MGIAKIGSVMVVLLALTFALSVYVAPVVADHNIGATAHDASVTLSPGIASCGAIPNKFTVNVANTGGSSSYGIYNVKIYTAQTNIVNLTCGSAPTNWTFNGFKFDSYCEYETDPQGNDVIEDGENLDFTFDALLNQSNCTSTFRVSTLDNEAIVGSGQGEEEDHFLTLLVDCSPPEIFKKVGMPKLPGQGFDYWITQNTMIHGSATEYNTCDLGFDYCEIVYSVDGGLLITETFNDSIPGMLWNYTWDFDEDSKHDILIECVDVAGNKNNYTEIDRVDTEPPVTTKTISQPKKIVPDMYGYGDVEWIDTATVITLDAIDPEAATTPQGVDCSIGVKEIYWANTIVNDQACWEPDNYCTPIGEVQYNVVQGNQAIITKANESCHLLEYYAVDELGNKEKTQANCFFVDKTPPEQIKTVGQPNLPCRGNECLEFEYWVQDHVTPITLDCDDSWNQTASHPSGDEEVCYKVSYDVAPFDLTSQYCSGSLETVTDAGYAGDWCCVPAPETVIFVEDSLHDLEYFCRDAVNKKSPIDLEWFRVDSLPPIISKVMIGPDHLGYDASGALDPNACPPRPGMGDTCYVRDDGINGVNISVMDDDSMNCSVGVDFCSYGLWWFTSRQECATKYPNSTYDPNDGRCPVDSGQFTDYKEIYFQEDSRHDLYINCWDLLGNKMPRDLETFLVDSTPPETKKTYGTPHKIDPNCYDIAQRVCTDSNDPECVEKYTHQYCTWWITTSTDITLDATDAKIGVEKIYYRNQYFPNNPEVCDVSSVYQPVGGVGAATVAPPCNPASYSQLSDYDDSIPWDEANGTMKGGATAIFRKTRDSCHVIEYYSEDWLGNPEPMKWQCVYVDDTPPISTKQEGSPLIPGTGYDYVTQATTFNLSCADQQPHPVGQETIYWRFSKYVDEFQSPPTYEPTSGWYSALYIGTPIVVSFPDDCWHDIEFYCVDHLGNDERDLNNGMPNRQLYVVDTVPPEITKTVVGPQLGYDASGVLNPQACPPKQPGDICYIDGVTEIHVDVIDPQPHPVMGVTCDWDYVVNDGTKTGKGAQGVTPPFIINFPEESTHDLTIICRDALGNEITDIETFIVDKQEPVITKTYGQPSYPSQLVPMQYPHYITSATPITISAIDPQPHPSGVKELKYRTAMRSDISSCMDYKDCQADDPGNWTNWTSVTGDVYIREDSCHMIEIKAVDNVGKESIKKQCVFVDNQAPVPNKTVGEPKTPWDGLDAKFYQLDQFCLTPGKCWRTTILTPINLECIDPQPHPVDHETVCFKVELDAQDSTSKYCNGYNTSGGAYYDNKGFCCLNEVLSGPFYFGEVSEHNLEYYCVDALGNKNNVTDDEKFKVEDTAFEIELNRKWNLISVPVKLLDDSMDEVFKDVSDTVKTVWTYNGTDWFVYTPNNNNTDDSLTTMLPGWGYWVLSNASDLLVIGGSLFSPAMTPPSKQITTGWNLIGYYGADGLLGYYGPNMTVGEQAACALDSLGIEIFDKGFTALYSYWEPYNPYMWHTHSIPPIPPVNNPGLTKMDRMDPGAGYWLLAQEDGLYAPSTTCGGLYS